MPALPLGKIRHNLSAQGARVVREAWRAVPSRTLALNARDQAEEYGLRILALRGVKMPAKHWFKWEPISGPLNGFIAFFDAATGEEFAMVKLTAQPDQFKFHADHNGSPETALPIIPRKRAKAPAAVAPTPTPRRPEAPAGDLSGKVFWYLSKGRMHRTRVMA